MKISKNVLKIDPCKEVEELMIIHYITKKIYENNEEYASLSLRSMCDEMGLTLKKVRRIIDKLEDMEIFDIEKGKGKAPSKYRLIK